MFFFDGIDGIDGIFLFVFFSWGVWSFLFRRDGGVVTGVDIIKLLFFS